MAGCVNATRDLPPLDRPIRKTAAADLDHGATLATRSDPAPTLSDQLRSPSDITITDFPMTCRSSKLSIPATH